MNEFVTVRALARRARKEYGSLDGFAVEVVAAELYERERGLTPAGEAARADLESRMAGVLREMQLKRGAWVGKEPRKALLAAVLAVALGQRRQPEEAELELVGQQLELGTVLNETSGQSDIWIDWRTFDNFDRTFAAMDSGCDAGESGGDGGGDGGDGGDCGGGGD